jgi:hypothetical protein
VIPQPASLPTVDSLSTVCLHATGHFESSRELYLAVRPPITEWVEPFLQVKLQLNTAKSLCTAERYPH